MSPRAADRLRGLLLLPFFAIRSVVDYARLQRHFYRFSPARIRAFQRKAFRRTLSLARLRSPFYEALYAPWSTAEVVRSLPVLAEPGSPQAVAPPPEALEATVLDKSSMMAHFDGINTAGLRLDEVMRWAVSHELAKDYLGYFKGRFVVGLSSGTSGNKGIYVTPRALTERLPAVFLARCGVSPRMLPLRILFLLRVFSQGFADIRAPLLSLRYLSTMVPPEEIVTAAVADRANVLMSPPSLLRTLLPLAGRLKGRLARILCYAEVLEDEDRARFEREFGAPVAQIYQASEGQIASPCRLGALHVNEDLALVELYDDAGRPVTEPGETASTMLVTNLVNDVQPIVRYRMNDRVELGGPCTCGSSFRTLRRVLGRCDDVPTLRRTFPDPATGADVRPVFPDLVSRWIITTDDAIREFRLAVFTPDALELCLDLLPGTPPEEAERVRLKVERRLGAELAACDVGVRRLAVRLGPVPPPSGNLKFRRFVNLTPRQTLDRALARVARAFAAAGVPFGVCSSMLLALRGLDVEPHDLDLLVAEGSFDAAREALRGLGADFSPERTQPHAVYGTRRFAEATLDGAEIDLMEGLSVFVPEAEYRFDLRTETVDRLVPAPEPDALADPDASPALLPLTSLEDWFVLYLLIPGRAAKAAGIERHLRAHPPEGAAREDACRRLKEAIDRPLPEEVRMQTIALYHMLRTTQDGML